MDIDLSEHIPTGELRVQRMHTIVDSPTPQRQVQEQFDSKLIHQILSSNRAKMVASATNLEEVYWSTSIEDVLRMFENSECYILARKCNTSSHEGLGSAPIASDVVFNRIDLFSAALKSSSLLGPLSSIAELAPKMTYVNGDDALDVVVQKMIECGREDIAVIERGIIKGLITTKSLIIFVRHQIQAAITLSLRPAQIVSLSHSRSIRGPGGGSASLARAHSLRARGSPTVISSACSRGAKGMSKAGNGTSNAPVSGGGSHGLKVSKSLRRQSNTPLKVFQSLSEDNSIDMSDDSGHALARTNSGQRRSATYIAALPVSSAFNNSSASDEDIPVKTKEESRNERYSYGQFSESQLVAQLYCISWCCELSIAGCVLLDLFIAIYCFINGYDEGNDKPFIATGCILAVYFYEHLMRAYGFFHRLLCNSFWILNFVIVDVSVLVYILILSGAISEHSQSAILSMQILRIIRILLIVRNINVTSRVRRAISSQKTRYRQDGFDLDLTYITGNVIAMSLPALGAEASYRNPMEEVQLFFAMKHPDHFLIFNLCKERRYDPELFDGRVERIEVEDHNPPRLNQIISFVERAAGFVQDDEANVIAVHCKGGKGRTGIMVCAWMLYSQFQATSDQALVWFSEARTGSKASTVQGVTQPSQKRYVRYAEAAFRNGGFYSPSINLARIVVHTCPRMGADGGWDAWFSIEENGILVYDYRDEHETDSTMKMKKDQTELVFEVDIELQGDVRIIFYDHDDGRDLRGLDALAAKARAVLCCGRENEEDHRAEGDEMCFFLWFHTGFVPDARLVLKKEELDIACHDEECRVFQESFSVEMSFDRVPDLRADSSEMNDRGPFREILPPSTALVEQSRAMLAGTAGPKAAQTTAPKPVQAAVPKLQALQSLGPSMARLSRMPSTENVLKLDTPSPIVRRRSSLEDLAGGSPVLSPRPVCGNVGSLARGEPTRPSLNSRGGHETSPKFSYSRRRDTGDLPKLRFESDQLEETPSPTRLGTTEVLNLDKAKLASVDDIRSSSASALRVDLPELHDTDSNSANKDDKSESTHSSAASSRNIQDDIPPLRSLRIELDGHPMLHQAIPSPPSRRWCREALPEPVEEVDETENEV